MSARAPAKNIRLKRAYEAASRDDGIRILVDRLWPRGVKKEDAAIDRWERDLAPSAVLRKWFGHDPARWAEFQRRYRQELKTHSDLVAELRGRARKAPVTLVYGARDEERHDAVVLRDVLLKG